MKTSVLYSAFAASALAAPTTTTSAAATSAPEPLKVNALAADDSIWGTINCDPKTKLCKVDCNLEGLDVVCQLVGIVDSIGFGIEQLVGFTMQCDNNGCQVICAEDMNLLCGVNEVAGIIKSIAVVGESVIIGGIDWLLDGIF